MTPVTIRATDGLALSACRFDPPAPPRAAVVIAPAMAIPQSFYAPFAAWLAGQGFVVWTFDYRGTGDSWPGKRRGAVGDLSDWVGKDHEGMLGQVRAQFPALPLFAIGHSFGGQSAPLLPSRHLLRGLVNIAVGSGAMRHNAPAIRRLAPVLWYLLVPVLCPLFGYFPGAQLGIIGDVPSGAMRQWRRWCLSPDYLLGAEPGARQAYASATTPVLALTLADDELLLEAGSRMLHEAYLNCDVDYRLLEPAQYGLRRIGHSGFFRHSGEPGLWPQVAVWIDRIASGADNETPVIPTQRNQR